MSRYWESPETTGLNRLRPQPVGAASLLDLNGSWQFQLRATPDATPLPAWREVQVPSLWTMGDFGDAPQYTNVQMPFLEQAPNVPTANPTGVYKRTIVLPGHWAGSRVVLSIGGFEGVLRVELNGALVGLAKDGRIAAEFDVTGHLFEGENCIELIVSKWSDASFIEDQDQWWHAGISRAVGLYATPRTHLTQLDVTPSAESGTASLRVRAAMSFDEGRAETNLALRIRVPELEYEHTVALSDGLVTLPEQQSDRALAQAWFTSEFAVTGTPSNVEALMRQAEPTAAGTCDETLQLAELDFWSAENPRLYEVQIELLDAMGTSLQSFEYRLGFRSVVVRDGELLVNDQPVVLYGVNRHDFHPRTGRVLSAQDVRDDLLELKRWNINAIRTAHYPNDPALLQVADELGFYVVAEANIESHAYMHTLADDPRYLSAFVERVSRMVQRDLRHASVILWSLGNESGYGANHDSAAAWVRRFDPTRPLHYEGAIRGNWRAGHSATDIVCPMYPSIGAIVRYAESDHADRPLIMCEYSHAMGNSNGSLSDYWHEIERHRGLQGGFVWEMWDHGLVQRMPDGLERFAYGGDFGEARHDGNFCCDGLFFPDRTAKPAMHELKALAAPFVVEDYDVESGQFTIRNRQFFADASDYLARWCITEDGRVIAEGLIDDLVIPARGCAVHAVPEPAPPTHLGGERFLTISMIRRSATPWSATMSEVGWTQFALPAQAQLAPLHTVPVDAHVSEDGHISLGELKLVPKISLWRAPTDNDRIGGLAERWSSWGVDALTLVVDEVTSVGADGVSITARWCAPDGTFAEHRRFVTMCEGGVRVREFVFIPDTWDDLARVGVQFELPLADEVQWFGRGPHECYPDRSLAQVGRWSVQGDAAHVDYIRPQSNGARTDVRWLEVTVGAELWRITNDQPRTTSFGPFSDDQLAGVSHREELGAARRTVVNVDAAMRGVGTASCGPDALPQYRVAVGAHAWTWTMQRLR